MKIKDNTAFKKILIQLIKSSCSPIAPIATKLPVKLNKIPNIRCVLFDVYGTLFISDAGDISHRSKCNRNIQLNNILESCSFKVLQTDCGESAEKLFHEYILSSHASSKNLNPEIDVREIWQGVLDYLLKEKKLEGNLSFEKIELLSLKYEFIKNPVWPMPHLKETLDLLNKKKLHLGLISNAQFFTPLLFEAFLEKNLEEYNFQKKLFAWSYEHKVAKPSQHLFKLVRDILSEQFQVLPDQVIYIGNDALNDIKPASECGFRTVLFAGDKRSLRLREDLKECKNVVPDAVITDLLQLCEIIIA